MSTATPLGMTRGSDHIHDRSVGVMVVKSMPLKWLLSFISVLLISTTSTVMGAGAAHADQAGITWTSQATTDNLWDSVTYGSRERRCT